jgi:hypothetical protein
MATRYEVFLENASDVRRVTADYVEIEQDGVLVFYDKPDPENPSISDMAEDDTIVQAFKQWQSLRKTYEL